MSFILIESSKEYQENYDPWFGLERIRLDISNPQSFNTTRHYWKKYGWITYKVRVQIGRIDDKNAKIHIEYRRSDNQHLFDKHNVSEEDIVWGTHILSIDVNESCGRSVWNNDEGPGWRKEKVIGEHRRITTTKLQRDQTRFREMLLNSDLCCAVTCESCPIVLEAAHIVPVRNGGQEVLSNGMLLRADLHRIFDADPPGFDICPETGKIFMNENCHCDSLDLHARQIKAVLLERISEALKARDRMSQ